MYGLCGTMNNNFKDEFQVPSGITSENIIIFIKSFQLGSQLFDPVVLNEIPYVSITFLELICIIISVYIIGHWYQE